MPSALPASDRDHAIELYRSGLGAVEVARRVGCDPSTVSDWVRKAGIHRTRSEAALTRFARGDHPRLRKDIPSGAIVASYQSGRSLQSLAREHGVDPRVIIRVLDESGVRRRKPDEAWAQVDSVAMREAIAEGCDRNVAHVGWGEDAIASTLRHRGERPHQQRAVGQRNVDITVGPIAVEVWKASTFPLNDPYTRERIEDLGHRGWSVMYVFISPRTRVLDTEAVADQIIAHLEFTKANPSSFREHRVVRGTGKLVARCKADLHPIPYVKTPVRGDHTSAVYRGAPR